MEASLNVIVPHAWHHIRQIRQRVAETLRDCDGAFRDAAIMTASELMENAVKYGEHVAHAKEIVFSLGIHGDRIVIQVKNGAWNVDGVRELQARVRELATTADKGALYMARLEELLAMPTESGKLGIYRIGFEGQFDLECQYEDEIVTMTARRTLP